MADNVTTPETVRLAVESPDMRDRRPGVEFAVQFPKEISEEEYQLIHWNLEFRRRCMNQGFDNLLELLDNYWQTYQRRRAKPADQPTAKE